MFDDVFGEVRSLFEETTNQVDEGFVRCLLGLAEDARERDERAFFEGVLPYIASKVDEDNEHLWSVRSLDAFFERYALLPLGSYRLRLNSDESKLRIADFLCESEYAGRYKGLDLNLNWYGDNCVLPAAPVSLAEVERLDVGGCNTEFEQASRLVAMCSERLWYLDIYQSSFGDRSPLEVVLCAKNPSALRYVNVSDNGEVGSDTLVRQFAESCRGVEALYLFEMLLSSGQLLLMTRATTQLKTLMLVGSFRVLDDFRVFMEALRTASSLEGLYLHGLGMGPDQLDAVLRTLQCSPVKEIGLYENHVSPENLHLFLDPKFMPNLEVVHIDGSSLAGVDESLIHELIEVRPEVDGFYVPELDDFVDAPF